MLSRNRREGARNLIEARRQFEVQGLPFPHIPQEMEAGFRRLNEWVFGTGHHGRGLYDIDQFIMDALNRPMEEFLLLGQAGRGIQSYAMHYYVARYPLYLFLQIAYGGAYTDSGEAIESMKRSFGQAESLIKNLPGAVRRGVLGPDERWVIADSDLYGSSWIRVNCPDPQDNGHKELDKSRGVLEQVLERLDI
jgi:hypothetical protein